METKRRFVNRLLLLLGVCFISLTSLASHFRHGTISWRVLSGNTIEFKVSQAYAGYRAIGTNGNSDRLYFGDGSSQIFTISVTSSSSAENWHYGEATFTHTYANTGNFTAYFQSCCKIYGMVNNSSASWKNETIVNVGAGNDAPVVTMAPIIAMQVNSTTATFQVPATDPDNDVLSYRLATYNEILGYQPSGLSINSTTGQLTFNTTSASVGQLYNAAIVVEDGQTKVINDFIIKIVQQSNPPEFDYTVTPNAGYVYQTSPGQPVTFNVKALDTDPGSTVQLSAIGAPLGSSFSPNLPTTSNPVQTTFTWTPTASNLGTNVINFIAQDNVGSQVNTSVSIIVSLKPQFDVPPTPATGSHDIAIAPGSTYTYTVQASDPDPLDVVQIVNVQGKNMMGNKIPLYAGASFSSLPSAAANPTSGTFSWTPTVSQWGHRHVFFTAEDSYGDQTVHEVYQVVNSAPAFTSSPVTTADVGTAYTYNVVVADPDMAYGDVMEIVGLNLPSWLTLNDNGDGTATLTGTPSPSDAGTANIQLRVEDALHHQDPAGTQFQNFSMVVNNCSVNAIAQNITVTLDQAGNASISGSDVNSGSTASCGIASMSVSPSTFTCADLGSNTVTLTVTDINGNTGTATSTVEVVNATVINSFNAADYVINGNAVYQGSQTYRLTQALNSQFGSMWYQNKLDLTTDFELDFDIYLGTQDWGADGMAFVLQPLSTGQGTSGGGIGYMNISPSLAVEFDTYTNSSDPYADHIALQKNGDVSHYSSNALVSPVSVGNMENGQYHNVVVTWDASSQNYQVKYDGTTVINYTGNIQSTVFSGNSGVYWGWTAATGGANNEHRVKVNSLTFTENFAVTSGTVVNASCANNADGSIDVEVSYNKPCISYSWSNGATTQDISNLLPGTYTLTITNPGAANIIETYTVGVNDVDAPNAIAQNIDAYLDASGNVSITAAQIDNGSSDACGIASITIDNSAFTCANVGPNPVTLTVTDVNGNSANASAIVTVIDNIAPTMATQDITVYLDANGNASIAAADVDNGSADACGVTLSVAPSTFTCGNTGANTVTLTGTDANGNVNTATATVTVVDNTAPNANTQDVTVYLDANGNASILGAPSTQQVFDGSFSNEALGANLTSLVDWNVIYGSVDVSTGFIPSATSGISVDLSGNNNSKLESVQNITFTPGTYTVSFLHRNNAGSGESNQNFNLSVGTLMNQSFNSTNSTQSEAVTFTVANTTSAIVTLEQLGGNDASGCFIADLSIDKAIPAGLMINNGSDDNCGIASLTASQTDFDCSHVGGNTVTLTAVDNSGNTSSSSATVTVIDNIAPTAIAQDMIVALDVNGNASITAGDIDNGSNDACGVSLSLSQTAFDCSHVGNNTVTLTVVDPSGNTSTATANVLVEDNIAPIAIAQDMIIALDANGNAAITANDIDNGSNDACGVSLSLSQTAFNCSHVGNNIVTLTVVDPSGNTSTATANVLVEDNIAPTAIAQDMIVALDVNGNASITAGDIDNGSNDACGVSLSLSQTAFDCSHVGNNTVTLTVVDPSGNTSTATANVLVEDNIAPIAIAQDVVIALDASGNASITTGDIDNGSNDACGVTLSLDNTAFTCADLGNNTVTLTVVDPSGNTSTATANVLVEDNIAPTIVCPANITFQAQPNNCSPSITWNAPQVWDNCSYTVVSNYQSGDNFEEGITTVNYTITDAAGNTATCSFDIEITTVPLSLSLNPVTYAGGWNISCNGLTDGSIDATMDGGCLPYTYAWSDGQTSEDATGLGAGTYTLTVTDAKGRTISETVTLTEPDVLTSAIGVSPQYTVAGQNQYTIYLGYGAQTVTMSGSANGGTTAYAYAWTDDQGVNVGNTAVIDVSPVTPTNYTLTVTDANGCTTTSSFFIDVIDARCGKNMNKVLICHKESKRKKGKLNVSYHNICVSSNAVAAHLAHGDYLGPCLDSKSAIVDVVEEENIVLFPNPNNGMFSLFFTGAHENDAEISIYSVDGKLLMTQHVSHDELDHDVEFDISNHEAGLYLVIVKQGDSLKTIKFSKN